MATRTCDAIYHFGLGVRRKLTRNMQLHADAKAGQDSWLGHGSSTSRTSSSSRLAAAYVRPPTGQALRRPAMEIISPWWVETESSFGPGRLAG